MKFFVAHNCYPLALMQTAKGLIIASLRIMAEILARLNHVKKEGSIIKNSEPILCEHPIKRPQV